MCLVYQEHTTTPDRLDVKSTDGQLFGVGYLFSKFAGRGWGVTATVVGQVATSHERAYDNKGSY